jgi:hypothetical protein
VENDLSDEGQEVEEKGSKQRRMGIHHKGGQGS